MLDEKLKLLHALGIQAREIIGSEENEPRTVYRIAPDGTGVISFYSSCFSFIDNNSRCVVFTADEIDNYINKAADEVKLLRNVSGHVGAVPKPFKDKPNIIPVVVFTKTCKRIYKVHLCKEHQKMTLNYNPHCKCYVTWEDIGEEDGRE